MRLLRNKRHLVTIVSALLLVGLSLVAYLYQPVENIDLNTYKRLLDQNRFTKAAIVGNRVILYTPEKAMQSSVRESISQNCCIKCR